MSISIGRGVRGLVGKDPQAQPVNVVQGAGVLIGIVYPELAHEDAEARNQTALTGEIVGGVRKPSDIPLVAYPRLELIGQKAGHADKGLAPAVLRRGE